MQVGRAAQHAPVGRVVDSEVNPMEIRALRYFARHPLATQRDLVAHSGRDKGQVARILADLRERSLLDAQADEQDRRITRLQVSAAGLALLEAAGSHTAPLVAAGTAGLSEADRRPLVELLRRVQANLDGLPD
ncbi:MarR family winged helix-turn-helix transcriptional regulator [Sphaerotilus microaerophilus]|uniref:HTH marR-type domain-containing protein n=1 Tax=Sphaerotilus microaerophilus TaxID=2914710 RepID=A0ABM7YQD9_9BURK|nr:helix-turn-helix domain-containing protein [Sphaerotilus sp. FB-5]BDI06738.1 hypothetical protein CATMQ487_37080 [Sphaerotilus sp. FB-5]